MRNSVALLQRVTADLQRRSVFHVAGVYGAVAFVVLQAADLMFPALMLSETTYRMLVWVVLAGFPVALCLAWFFDLTAQGVKRAARYETSEAEAPPARRALTRKFQVRGLVDAYGDNVCLVKNDVGRHQHRIPEQTIVHIFRLLTDLFLEGGQVGQLAKLGDH